MVVTVKDEGSLVGRGFFRVGAHAVGKIEQAVEVRQLFLFQQPVYIGEHRPEVGTAEAPELQPGDQLNAKGAYEKEMDQAALKKEASAKIYKERDKHE